MDAFNPIPPEWTQTAIHAWEFCCPKCKSDCRESQRVWINRRSPVITGDYRKKWQEFYQCQCGSAWWAWSSDRPSPPPGLRPPSELSPHQRPTNEDRN